MVEKAQDIEVIGEAADGQEALELVDQLAPDVLVIDIAMPRLDGLQAIGRMQADGVVTRAVVLSMYSDETLVRQALRSGARGYLLKRSVTEELLLAIRSANRGDIYLSPAVARSIATELLELQTGVEPSGPSERLTSREREVLQLVAEGHTNRAIAQMLHISVKTVEKHRSNLMSKLHVHDLAGLICTAIKHRLVFLDE